MVFNRLDELAEKLKAVLSQYEPVDEGHNFEWPNYVYKSSSFRRAHLDIVDARASKKLYMMHLCVFPNTNDPSPIYGFDIIAGPNKVTGAFHDFSPVSKGHHLIDWFKQRVSLHTWKRERELPEWAAKIFSPHIITATNIQTGDELDRICSLMLSNLDYYLNNIGESTANDYTDAHNWYCSNQKQNPHTPRVMEALGLNAEKVKLFIRECLFPEIPYANVGSKQIEGCHG
jgi:hypothetical protein